MKKLTKVLCGIPIGIVNSLLGAGGGLIAVPILRKTGMSQQEAQASTISVILPLCAISAVGYILRGNVAISDALIFIIPGILGSLLGAFLLKKIPDKWLRKLFAVFMIWSGVRMMIK